MIMEQLLTLFRGDQFISYLKGLRGNEDCLTAMNQFEYNVENHPEKKFESFVRDTHTNVYVLFGSMFSSMKKHLQQFGNLICTVCNPWETAYFKKA